MTRRCNSTLACIVGQTLDCVCFIPADRLHCIADACGPQLFRCRLRYYIHTSNIGGTIQNVGCMLDAIEENSNIQKFV